MTSPDHPRLISPAEARTYIVRIWPERYSSHSTTDGSVPTYVWRATVLRGTTGERRSFASLQACLQHLHDDWLQP